MIGKRYGKLVVGEKQGRKWLCKCDCGGTKLATTGHLNAGSPTSCGCIKFHGHAGERSREYITYHNMMTRCYKATNKRYKDYGAKGITVCKEWRDSFIAFIKDMGNCPEGHQIDRRDNNKGYNKNNCRWVTREVNMRNRKGTYKWYVDGKSYGSAGDAATENNVSIATITAWCAGRIAEGNYYPPKSGCYREARY